MNSRSILFILYFVWAVVSAFASPDSFEQARTQSIETGKPILLEFVHED